MSLLAVEDALEKIFARIPAPVAEWVSLASANGRVLAAPLVAQHNQPPFSASAMDGYAVRSADFPAGEMNIRSYAVHLRGVSAAGARFEGTLGPNETVRIFTGAPLPEGADAVIMQEDAIVDGEAISFKTLPKPGLSVRPLGYDFKQGQELLPAGFQLTPYAMTLAAASNQPHLSVYKRPTISLLMTGDELVSPGSELSRDQIVSANNYGLHPLLSPLAEAVADLGIVGDNPLLLKEKLSNTLASGTDILVTSGGASVGDHDIVQSTLKSLGVQMDFWRLNLRPGKPLMFGFKDNTLVFGLPGNPVSALVTATLFLLPTLRYWQGMQNPLGPRLRLPLGAPLRPNSSRRHYQRATIKTENGISTVLPISETDSGHTSSLALAQALLIQEGNAPAQAAGEFVDVIPLPFWS